jgi:hypothetical protein
MTHLEFFVNLANIKKTSMQVFNFILAKKALELSQDKKIELNSLKQL